MSKYEIYAKRDKTFQFDTLKYDSLPNSLRIQIYYIWRYSLKADQLTQSPQAVSTFASIRDYICRELGLEYLYVDKNRYSDFHPAEECEMYLRHGTDIEILLSLIELSIRSIPHFRSTLDYYSVMELTMSEVQAIEELNLRFKENGVGYEFLNGMIIRKDSEILHEEVTKPALYLLQEKEFKGALQEFLQAHDHFRKGNYSESVLYAGKSFESTMRTIGDREEWGLTGKENASDLISTLVKKEVIPSYFQTALQGLGTVRNKVAHGQGEDEVMVPEYFVNYALHLCGTNIVMLIEAYKEFSK